MEDAQFGDGVEAGDWNHDPNLCFACQHRLCSFGGGAGSNHHVCLRSLQRGERLDLANNDCLRFWVVIAGTAATCTTLQDGRRQIICIDCPGDLICSMAASTAAESWVEALSDCKICQIDLSAKARELRGDSEFLGLMFQRAHERLEQSVLQSVVLGRLDSLERLCLFLAERAGRSGTAIKDGKGVRIHLPMSREDIADYLGLNSETVSRNLGRIKRAGLAVFLSPTEIVVPDMGALKQRIPLQVRPVHIVSGPQQDSIATGGAVRA